MTKNLLTLKLLGSPSVFLNQEEIFFPFAKINALLYYLHIKGTVNREEIAGILWENKDNQTAKKNLRNTIYQANKLLGGDWIIAPNRTVLSLNPKFSLESDAALFSQQPAEHLSLYGGDFLQGFYLKDSEAFDFWVSKMRTEFEQLYIKACYQRLEEEKDRLDLEEAESNLHRLIRIDEFDEKNYQLLMKLYQDNNRPGKVIETYYKLVNLLDKELGISPNEHIQQIYHEVVAKDRNERKTKQFLRNTDHFFGRVDEIKRLESYFSKILEGQEARALVLVGGTGIGKRTVTRQVLANQTKYFQIVMAECFREEMTAELQPWRGLLDGLGDLVIQHQILSISQWQVILETYFPILEEQLAGEAIDSSRLAQFVVDILQKISKKKALVVLIEDCHWLDSASVAVLEQVINHLSDYPVAFVLTKHLNTPPYLEHFLNHLLVRGKLDFIDLQPLSQTESAAYLQAQLGTLTVSEQEADQIYQISQGIPFFLSEYAQELLDGEKFHPLTPAIKAKLSLKMDQISSREEELLHYLACFRGSAALSVLTKLMALPLEEMVEITEELEQKHLLREDYDGEELVLQFSQQILQLYAYDRLSLAKRRILHNQIAQGMEALLEGSLYHAQLFREIAYHYKMSKQAIKSLEYELHYLDATLQFHHELFPIYSREFGFIEKMDDANQSAVLEQFDRIRRRIGDLEGKHQQHRDFQLLVLRFLYLEGRYSIRRGHYRQGMDNIQRVISAAKELNQLEFLLEGYRQVIYYCIQTENIPEMRYYTELALDASVQANNHEAIAVNLRLKGLYHLMVGEEEKAAHHLCQSIDCFSLTPSLRSKYSIQIAAALDYLAEIEQVRGDFQAALAHQKEAIGLTENKTAEPSLIVFYIGLGISYYFLGDYEQAEQIFLRAKKELASLSFPWKEAQLEVYLALIDCAKEDYQPVLDLLHKKEQLIARYANPRDKGMIYYLMALLKHRQLMGSIEQADFEDLLPQHFDSYYDIAKAHLNPYRDRHQLEDLENLRLQLP
ncbi:AAA family ATPase [Streptococcus panodentis]|uniref:LuxR family transcriptional regulator n=1 Tax=Streptococcus panodentis TaxID=1581472 RepID=A0ABS5AU30_9STRE|nr:AAA family ATPase [Streptococcus panodentis]MBP2619995.1 LuxR family transcriptional regulator [Streptococcus panodentis]